MTALAFLDLKGLPHPPGRIETFEAPARSGIRRGPWPEPLWEVPTCPMLPARLRDAAAPPLLVAGAISTGTDGVSTVIQPLHSSVSMDQRARTTGAIDATTLAGTANSITSGGRSQAIPGPSNPVGHQRHGTAAVDSAVGMDRSTTASAPARHVEQSATRLGGRPTLSTPVPETPHMPKSSTNAVVGLHSAHTAPTASAVGSLRKSSS